MEWYTKGVFFLQKWYVKGKEWDLEAGLPRIKLYWGPPGGVIVWQFVTRDTEKCSFSILTRLTYEHQNIWTFCRFKRTIRFIRVFALSETAGFRRIWSTTFFAGGPSVRDGGVHSLWFLSSEQYQSFVLKIQQFLRLRSLITLSFQDGEQRLK